MKESVFFVCLVGWLVGGAVEVLKLLMLFHTAFLGFVSDATKSHPFSFFFLLTLPFGNQQNQSFSWIRC